MSDEENRDYESGNYGGDDNYGESGGGGGGGYEEESGGQYEDTQNYEPQDDGDNYQQGESEPAEPDQYYQEPEPPEEPDQNYQEPEPSVEPEQDSPSQPEEENYDEPEPEQPGEPDDEPAPEDGAGDVEPYPSEADDTREPEPELPEAVIEEEEEDETPLDQEEVDNYVAEFCNADEDLQCLLTGDVNACDSYPEWDMTEEDSYMQMNLEGSAFSGLVGNTNCDFFNTYSPSPQYYNNRPSNYSMISSGHAAGQKKFGKMDLAKMLFSMGKTVYSHMNKNKAASSGGGKGIFGKIFKGIMGGGGGAGGMGGNSVTGGATSGKGFGGIGGIFSGLAEGKGIGTVIGGLIAGSGGFGNRGTFGDQAGGGNISKDSLNGGVIEKISSFVGDKLHKCFGIDPSTGKVIGAIAGNVIFHLGGKDNKLGGIGKVILDNIVSGKSQRKVDPYVPAGGDWGAQNFVALRDECLKNRQLFEDPTFPASDQSLFFSQAPPKQVEWLRPGEICRDPQLFVEGHSRFDIVQGELGDCWLLAATATLTLRDELFYRVVPPDQSFTDNYAGIFHFQFWHYGKWVDVVIDDRLPCHNGKLLYLHSSQNNEFWSALLEKAYAKLFGSYEALKGGNTCEALEDFTGGLTEFIDLKDPPANLLQMVFKSFKCGSLMGCSIEADPKSFEAKLPNGLVRGHAYSITGARMIDGRIPLLRIRNPWGNQQEWNGPWSDNSSEWNSVSPNVRQEIGLTFAHDGEFWMSFDDFSHNFEKVEMCHLGPDVMNDIEQMTGSRPAHKQWQMQCMDGEWIRGQTAGGCRNFLNTFTNNPQFAVSLPDPEPGDNDGLSVSIMSVLQKNRRERRSEGIDMLPIGFAVYEASGSSGPLSSDFIAKNKSCARSPIFINLREIAGRFRFRPGNYVMIPSTFEPDNEASFMVRIFSYPSLKAWKL